MEVQIKDNKIFAPLSNKLLVNKSEEKVRQEYICRLVNNYGFSLDQMAQDISDNQIESCVDIVVWKNKENKKRNEKPLIVVQCKAEQISINIDDYFKGVELAKKLGADFFVATNMKQTKIFSKIYKLENNQPNELLNIPTYEQSQDSKELKSILTKTNEFTRNEFSKTLFKCHNIIRNNDKLSPEAAFDEISKILFIKTLYERANKDGSIFTKDTYLLEKKTFESLPVEKKLPFYRELFEKVKSDLKDDDLFDQNETIKIKDNSFEDIIKELEIYNLATTSDDIKGIAFEHFLGKTFRGELGQFFTPRTIVDFMVEVLDPVEGETICDPCCGSGGFMIKAFEFVRTKIEAEIHIAKEKIKSNYYNEKYKELSKDERVKIDEKVNKLLNNLNLELDVNNKLSRIHNLSYNCIYGTDANPRMSRTAKMNMIMHGDGHGGVHHNDGLLNVNGIFENRFDLILTNPPFGSRVEKTLKITEADKYTNEERIAKYRRRYGSAYDAALKQVNDNIGKPLLDLYQTSSFSTLTEVLFIERCLNLLKPGGRMGIVLPEGVLNNSNLQKVREFVESRAKILLITSIPQDVFTASGATVKPSLLFFKKFTDYEKAEWKRISIKAEKDVSEKYAEYTRPLLAKLEQKGKNALTTIEKKAIKIELKHWEDKIKTEIKAQHKLEFNYEIPIAEVQKAGINSIGAEIDNELKPLATEFIEYAKSHNLWHNKFKAISYETTENNQVLRKVDGVQQKFYENE